MANYRIVYGDDEQVVRETFTDVELYREDGWLVIFRGKDAIVRVRDEHVQSIEEADQPAGQGEVVGPATALAADRIVQPKRNP
jgi:hypothetical protein